MFWECFLCEVMHDFDDKKKQKIHFEKYVDLEFVR